MIKYTEIFYSIQGEAKNTGKLCTWLRFFTCNLQCRGFSQLDPSDPSTWVEQRTIDPTTFKTLQEVPTPNVGCDSDYSWSSKFKHLVEKRTARELTDNIRNLIPSKKFGTTVGHCFTGGEPMLQQQAICDIVNHWINDGDYPQWICIETNGTQKLIPEFINLVLSTPIQFYFSISPKLLHVSGEQPKKAIKIDCIQEYISLLPESYLKFVLNHDQRAWDQAQDIVDQVGNQPEVWVMPLGAVYEQQTDHLVGKLADKAIFEYQWNVSPRVHVLIWNNDQIGR